MKSRKEIEERINKLDKNLFLTAKHHDKYIELYHKACDSWSCKDFWGSRARKYRYKYTELYNIWREMTYYKKGLEWVLDKKYEVLNDR